MSKFCFCLTLFAIVGCKLPDENYFQPGNNKTVPMAAIKGTTGTDGPLKTDSTILIQKIKAIYKKAKAENCNTQHALLANLGLHSGSKRFYVVDLSNQSILASGLVTHGSSTIYLPDGKRKYSNENGSLCSSLGMYKIGALYRGKFGLAYKLYGLNKSNSNAYARAIVLHSHNCVPDEETANPICQSWGCPTVSPAFLKKLGKYIDTAQKPMLLYLFDSSL